MKALKFVTTVLLFTFTLFLGETSEAQIRIGGGVNIDICLPVPEIIITNPRPQRRVERPRRRTRRVIRNRDYERCEEVRFYGEVVNQYRGRDIIQKVVDIDIIENRNGIVEVAAFLNGGDVLSFTLKTLNFNDYNYHYNFNRRARENRILEIRFNDRLLPVKDGSISLQPKPRGNYEVVLNIHNRGGDNYFGNFSTF